MEDAEQIAQPGRLERLRFLLDEGDFTPGPISGLAYEYYEEARLCWYTGAFVATIVMSQLAFEESLRAHYRLFRGVGGLLDSGKEVDRSGFAELVRQARHDDLISSKEAESFDVLRKDYRNAYVHAKDYSKTHDSTSQGYPERLPGFAVQHLKIAAPDAVEISVENEAREAIRLLISQLPGISRRLFGI